MDDAPSTEDVNPSTVDLDLLPTSLMLHRINDEDRRAASAVEREIDAIAAAVDAIAERLLRGGRLRYFGAGTSGRIAAADAAELAPTFGTPPDLVVAHIAGGDAALKASVEGAEDDDAAGRAAVAGDCIGAHDAVVGLSASGSTPFVLGALRAAADAKALTVAIITAERSPLAEAVDVAITLRTGAEAIAGSTRMKAASAQKMALTALSTAVMVRLGRTFGNLMVGAKPANAKLRRRALHMTSRITRASDREAENALEASGGDVRVAAVMLEHGVDADAARRALEAAGGSLRSALAIERQ